MSKIDIEFQSVIKDIENDIQKGLHDLIPDFKKAVHESTNENVYEVYYPKDYNRRMENGGLGDEDNYEVIEDRLSLTLINNTPNNSTPRYGGYVTDIIESGLGYNWSSAVPARPFMDKALERFVEEKVNPMLDDLNKG